MQMLTFCMPVTISELVLTLALSGDPSISSTRTIADSAGLGTVDLLCVFGIRNKNGKSDSAPETQFRAFCSGFRGHAGPCLPT